VLELRRLRRFGAWRWREVDDTVFSIVWWECKQIDLLPFLPFLDGILHVINGGTQGIKTEVIMEWCSQILKESEIADRP
jgi:hypothetical protein